MLQVVKKQHKTRFVIICDYCRQEIQSELGIVAWRIRRDTLEVADGTIYTLHQGICQHAITDSDNTHQKSLYQWLWSELKELPGELLRSLGITWERAQGNLELPTVEEVERMRAATSEIQQQLREWEESANADAWGAE